MSLKKNILANYLGPFYVTLIGIGIVFFVCEIHGRRGIWTGWLLRNVASVVAIYRNVNSIEIEGLYA